MRARDRLPGPSSIPQFFCSAWSRSSVPALHSFAARRAAEVNVGRLAAPATAGVTLTGASTARPLMDAGFGRSCCARLRTHARDRRPHGLRRRKSSQPKRSEAEPGGALRRAAKPRMVAVKSRNKLAGCQVGCFMVWPSPAAVVIDRVAYTGIDTVYATRASHMVSHSGI
jgi:hypothetical protein